MTFNYQTAITGVVAVQTSSTVIRQFNERRRRIIFVNDGATTIYLHKSAVAITGSGIRLNANGGSYEDLPDSQGRIYLGMWTAISSAACNLGFTEEYT